MSLGEFRIELSALGVDLGDLHAAGQHGFKILHGQGPGECFLIEKLVQAFGLQQDLLEQFVDTGALQGRDLDADRVAAPLFRDQSVFADLLEHAVGIGVGLVHFVDGHDEWYVGGLGVIDRLDRLGHHAVVRGDHENDDVGDLGAAGAHRGKGFVTGGVDESDRLALPLHAVGADVLGDATGFAGDHVGLADLVEQQRLAVVDVSHHRHDGRSRRGGNLVVLVVFVKELREERGLLLLAGIDHVHAGADFGGVELDHVIAQALHGRDDLALQEQEADNVRGTAIELRSDVLGRGTALDDDFAVGNGQAARLPRGHLGGLQLFDVAAAAARGLAL